MPDGFHDGDDGDDRLGCAGSLIAVTDHLDAGEGAHAVVHTHHALGIIGHEGEPVLHGVEAGLSAISKLILHVEVVLFAEPVPVVLLGLWEHEDDLEISGILAKALQRPHQYGFPADG